MNCTQVKTLLSSFYDRELKNETSEQVERHLQGCADCSAELRAFEQLSAAVSLASAPAAGSGGWAQIAARLDAPADAAVHRQPAAAPIRSQAPTGRSGRMVFGIGLALAASLLLIAIVRMQAPTGSSSSGGAQAAVAIDYSTVIKQQAQQPSLALEAISSRFEGREVATEEVQDVLGYRPAILAAMPAETRLVSTHLLKLPNCRCAGGKCECGPQGCNCAASLCARKDGTEFLVFEHCTTQEISFGQLPSWVAARDSHPVQFIDTGAQLAVTWSPGARRVTAIGLKDRAEAESLIAALDTAARPPH